MFHVKHPVDRGAPRPPDALPSPSRRRCTAYAGADTLAKRAIGVPLRNYGAFAAATDLPESHACAGFYLRVAESHPNKGRLPLLARLPLEESTGPTVSPFAFPQAGFRWTITLVSGTLTPPPTAHTPDRLARRPYRLIRFSEACPASLDGSVWLRPSRRFQSTVLVERVTTAADTASLTAKISFRRTLDPA